MADLTDLQRIALSFPETTHEEGHIAYAVLNKGKSKGFAWVWMERVDPKKPKIPNQGVIAIRVQRGATSSVRVAGSATIVDLGELDSLEPLIRAASA